jgi:hypothetical protein
MAATPSDVAPPGTRGRPQRAAKRLGIARFIVPLALCVACGGAPPPKMADAAVPIARPAAPICAVASANLSPLPAGRLQCLEGVAPRASDLHITLTPRTATVSAGESVVLDIRLANLSKHIVSVRTASPRSGALVVTSDKGVTVAPPAEPMPLKPNPDCDPMPLSHEPAERDVVVALVPGGVIEHGVPWQASHSAWPPARLQDCKASWMGSETMEPVSTTPLASGTYRVTVTLRVWSEPDWIDLRAGADIAVR